MQTRAIREYTSNLKQGEIQPGVWVYAVTVFPAQGRILYCESQTPFSLSAPSRTVRTSPATAYGFCGLPGGGVKKHMLAQPQATSSSFNAYALDPYAVRSGAM